MAQQITAAIIKSLTVFFIGLLSFKASPNGACYIMADVACAKQRRRCACRSTKVKENERHQTPILRERFVCFIIRSRVTARPGALRQGKAPALRREPRHPQLRGVWRGRRPGLRHRRRIPLCQAHSDLGCGARTNARKRQRHSRQREDRPSLRDHHQPHNGSGCRHGQEVMG